MYVEDVKDRSNTPKGCNAMYVGDVKDGKRHTHTFWLITSLILNGFSIRKKFWKAETESFRILCMSKHVKDVKDGKRTYRHTFIIPFLIWYHLNVILSMSKMSKIDQIHLRAVMLCMSKMSKMGKEHTHTSSTSSTCFDIHRI